MLWRIGFDGDRIGVDSFLDCVSCKGGQIPANNSSKGECVQNVCEVRKEAGVDVCESSRIGSLAKG